MKTCSRCHKEKCDDNFSFRNKAKGIKHTRCKECSNLYYKGGVNQARYEKNRSRYKRNVDVLRARNRAFIVEYKKGLSCERCGYDEHPVALHFDHIDRDTKHKEITKMVNGCSSIENIKEEIVKCRVLCANCHAIRTSIQMGWYSA